MKRLFFCVIIFSVFLIPDVFPFAVEPSRLEFSVPAGGKRSKSITIDNTRGDGPVHVKIYAQDVTILPDGTSDYLPAGSTEWSCTNWIKVVPSEIDVPLGKEKAVRVSVDTPQGIKGGRYAVLFFEQGGLPGPIKGVSVNLRVGILIGVKVPGTEIYKARLADLSFNKPRTVEVNVFNEGNVLIRPEGKIKVINARGKRVASIGLNTKKMGILPQNARKLEVALDDSLPAGKYTLKAEVDFGADYLLVGELPIDIE